MKEVYVVTSGTYSDYGIDCIFTDLEKANKYAELKNNGCWDDFRVETYPLDEVSFEQTKIVEINAKKELYNDNYDFNYEILDVIDDDFDTNRTYVYIRDYSKKSSELTLRRKYKGNEDVIKKYKKVVEDYFFKIESNWDFYKTYEGRDLISDALEKDIDNMIE